MHLVTSLPGGMPSAQIERIELRLASLPLTASNHRGYVPNLDINLVSGSIQSVTRVFLSKEGIQVLGFSLGG